MQIFIQYVKTVSRADIPRSWDYFGVNYVFDTFNIINKFLFIVSYK
jgi:hypothetical protein